MKRRCLPQVVALLPVLIICGLSHLGCELNEQARTTVNEALSRYQNQSAADAVDYGHAKWEQSGATSSTPATTRPSVSSATGTQPASAPSSLRDLILIALQENPDVLAAERVVRSRGARVAQRTSLPDPALSTRTLPEPIQTAAGNNYFLIGIEQMLIVPDKLNTSGRVALRETQMAIDDLQQVRLRVIADVKRAYFRLYVIDETIRIDRTNQDLLRGLIDVARSQVAAGKRTQDDVLRAQVELSGLQAQIINLTQERETVVARLNRLMNRNQERKIGHVQPFDIRDTDSIVEHLFAAAEERNPELQRLRDQIERDREKVHLATLQYWPDFKVGLQWMPMEPRQAFRPPPNPQTGMPGPVNHASESGSDNWAITFGFNLPIWSQRIEAAIREARESLQASQHQYASERNRVYFEIEDALARVRAQQDLAVLFRDTIIPESQQAYEVSRADYTSGTTGFLFVIDNWQKWLTFTIQYHRALSELERSIADLEQAVGSSLREAGHNDHD